MSPSHSASSSTTAAVCAPKREQVEAAALNLVKESNPQDEVFIVNFNDEAYLDVPFTNDVKKMETGLARIDSRGGTAMRDAVDMSINYMKTDAKKNRKCFLSLPMVMTTRAIQRSSGWSRSRFKVKF